MSTSSPVRIRQSRRQSSQAQSNRPARGDSVVTVARLTLLAVAAVSVIGTSNYFAYMIGRKQASYEELRRQVDRVVHLMDQKQAEEEATPATKPRQERLEQNAPGLTGLTTSTINGKTTAVAPEPPPAEKPAPAVLLDDAPAAPPVEDVRSPPPAAPATAAAKPRPVHSVAQRRPKAPKPASTDAFAQQPSQTAPAAGPDPSASGQ